MSKNRNTGKVILFEQAMDGIKVMLLIFFTSGLKTTKL